MTFEIQYSKKAKFIAKTLKTLTEDELNKFKFMLALKAKELRCSEATYKIN